MWIFFIMLLVIGPRGGLGLLDAFGLRLIGITSQHSNQSSTTTSHRWRWPFSIASPKQKSLHWVPRYENPHTTFNSTKSF